MRLFRGQIVSAVNTDPPEANLSLLGLDRNTKPRLYHQNIVFNDHNQASVIRKNTQQVYQQPRRGNHNQNKLSLKRKIMLSPQEISHKCHKYPINIYQFSLQTSLKP